MDTEATEYARELDDAQLVALTGNIRARVEALAAQGVALPMAQIENHLLIGLLGCMVGTEESLRVREWHLSWMDRQLDHVESEVRTQLLKSGVIPNGDHAGGPHRSEPGWPGDEFVVPEPGFP